VISFHFSNFGYKLQYHPLQLKQTAGNTFRQPGFETGFLNNFALDAFYLKKNHTVKNPLKSHSG